MTVDISDNRLLAVSPWFLINHLQMFLCTYFTFPVSMPQGELEVMKSQALFSIVLILIHLQSILYALFCKVSEQSRNSTSSGIL